MRIIVIGGGAAGMSAAARAKRTNPSADVVVYEEGRFLSFGLCGIPYFISDEVKTIDHLVALSDEQIKKKGIEFHRYHRVIEIRPHRKQVVVRDTKERETRIEHFDRLVVASGAETLKISNVQGENIFYLRTLEDAQNLKDFIKHNSPRNAVVVGGGYIGMEMADAFNTIGMNVTLIEKLPWILPQFDRDMAEHARKKLEEAGITVRTGETVEGIDGKTLYTDRGRIDFDLALVSIGIKPRTELVQSARIETGSTGGIKVDSRMKTNQFSIYAAGDCIQVKHIVSGRDVYIPLGTTANKTGKVAGDNAAGGELVFSGVSGTGIFRTGWFDMAVTGLTETQADALGIKVKSVTISSLNKAHYMPESDKIVVKVVFKENGELVGAQLMGRGVERVNIFATAIKGKMNLIDMAGIDLAYSPPFAPVWDPVLIAVNQALKEVK